MTVARKIGGKQYTERYSVTKKANAEVYARKLKRAGYQSVRIKKEKVQGNPVYRVCTRGGKEK